MNLSMKQKQNYGHREQTWRCQGGEDCRRDGTGGWLADISCYTWNG